MKISDRELGIIIGILMSDGHIQKNKLRMDITSKNLEILRTMQKIFRKNFQVESKIRKCNSNKLGTSFNLGINNASLTKFFISLGVPRGSKTNTRFIVPNIVKKSEECFKGFISGLFSGDGTVEKVSKDRIAIAFEIWKRKDLFNNAIEFVEEIKFLLNKFFGIDSFIIKPHRINVRVDGTISMPVKLRIKKTESIFKFAKEIKLLDKNKQMKIEAWLASRSGAVY